MTLAIPETVEAAQAELKDIEGWLADFQQRQQQLSGALQRASALEMFLAVHEVKPAAE
jgi:hypothetical protein